MAEARHTLNAKALSSNYPAFFETIGNENLSLITDRGSSVVFLPVGGGKYEAKDDPAKKEGYLVESSSGFEHYRRDGYVYVYGTYGQLAKVRDRNEAEIVFSRESSGRLSSISAGTIILSFTYDGSGRLAAAGLNGERTFAYTYDGSGRLCKVTDASGDTVVYEYDGDNLTRMVKPDGTYREYRYETQGGKIVATRTADEEGNAEYFSYDLAGRRTTWTDRAGGVHTAVYDAKYRITRESSSGGHWKETDYDAAGNVVAEREPFKSVSHQYDARGNLIRTDHQDGSYETWSYEGNDLELTHRDRDGIVTITTRDGKGNVTRVMVGAQLAASHTVNGYGQITNKTDGAGNTVSYEYDGNGYLVKATYSDGTSEVNVNDAYGNVTEYRDRTGRSWKYRYDKEDRLISELRPSGLERTFAYSNRKDLVLVTERDTVSGKESRTTLAYDGRHLVKSATNGLGEVVAFTYNGDDKMTSKTIADTWRTEYGYDAAGNVASVTKTKGGQSGSYVELYSYDALNRLTRVEKPAGRTRSYTYGTSGWATMSEDSLGRRKFASVSAAGRLLGATSEWGGTKTVGYDSVGRISVVTDEDGDAESYVYDGAGRVAKKTDRNGYAWTYAYDGNGIATSVSVGGTMVNRYTYDGADRVLTVEDSSGSTLERWTYGIDGRSAMKADAFGNETKYEYNGWGRITQETDAEGRTRGYEYDAVGRVVKASDGYGKAETYEYDALGKMTGKVRRDGTRMDFAYDKLGKLIKVTDALGTVWTGMYDGAGRLVSEKRRPGTEQEYAYDAADRLVSRKSGGITTETYRYDDTLKTTERTDARGAKSSFAFDTSGRVTAETNRSGLKTRYEYDAEGRMKEYGSFGGKEIVKEYDAGGRVTSERHADGKEYRYRYDLNGRLLEAAGPDGKITYTYDQAGRLAKVTDGAAGETITYEYDKSGLRTAMRRGGTLVRYTYGKNRELASVNEDGGAKIRFTYDVMDRETRRMYGNGVVIETSYDGAGRVIAIRETQYGTGNIVRAAGYVYDDSGRLTHKVDEKARVTAYEYDTAGRLAAAFYPFEGGKRDEDKRKVEKYGMETGGKKSGAERYDLDAEMKAKLEAALRLAVGNRRGSGVGNSLMWAERFTYDANGNRLTKVTGWGTVAYEYGKEDELLSAGKANYDYDDDGHLTEEKTATVTTKYTYDGRGRVVKALVSGKTWAERGSEVRYSYDALGRRSERLEVGEDGERTVYDGFGFEETRSLMLLGDGSVAPLGFRRNASSGKYEGKYRYEGPGSSGNALSGKTVTGSRNTVYVKGTPASFKTMSGTYYAGEDQQGSVQTLTDERGNLFEKYEYDAFGGLIEGDLEAGPGYGYAGKKYDPVTGQYDYGFRDYAPNLARFTTVDPIRDGANWYTYCNADPVNYVDLFGLQSWDRSSVSNTPVTQKGTVPGTKVTYTVTTLHTSLTVNQEIAISKVDTVVSTSVPAEATVTTTTEAVDANGTRSTQTQTVPGSTPGIPNVGPATGVNAPPGSTTVNAVSTYTITTDVGHSISGTISLP